MNAYADTSFLASLYVLDGSATLAAARMKRTKFPLLITPFGEVELTNAVALRLFRKELSASQGKAAHALIRKDLEDGVLMVNALPANAFERAKQIARRQTPRWVPEHSTYFTWPPHLLCRRTLSTPSTRGKRNRPRPKGCLFVDPGSLNHGSI